MARACAPRVLSVHSTPPAPRRSVAPAPGDGAARGRAAGAGVLAGVLLLTSPMNAPPARAVDFVMASPAAVDGLRRRDEAMQFKCKGGMMDCDGDRREFARKQTENFIAKASGSPAADSSCKVEEACTKDVLGAAIAGLNGYTTAEKLSKLGRDPSTAVNSTGFVPQ